ncbi:MAG TPA: ATP-binding protein [Planctomycetota bacterium]|jgi:signal transduction histidine kinase
MAQESPESPEDLRERLRALQEVIASARCVLWEARVKRLPTGRHLWEDFKILSPAAVRQELGFGTDRSDGDIYVEHLPPAELERMDKVSYIAIETGQPGYQQEFSIYAADGSLRHMSEYVRIKPLKPGDFALVGVQVDMSERKRTEDALRSSEEQLRESKAMEAVGRFAAGAASYFGHLMSVVKGYSNLMLQCLDHKDAQRRNIEMLQKVVARATEVNEQLIMLGRSGMSTPRALDINTVVSDTCALLKPLLGRDIVFQASLEPDVGYVRADRTHIEQTIINLVINARQAMPSGGRLLIETLRINLNDGAAREQGRLLPGRYTLLAVSDTGTGMSEEVRARLFEPFFTTKGVAKGSGLGLATVATYIRRTGGDIEVSSELGRGTRFKIYLPYISPDEAAREAPPPQPEEV